MNNIDFSSTAIKDLLSRYFFHCSVVFCKTLHDEIPKIVFSAELFDVYR